MSDLEKIDFSAEVERLRRLAPVRDVDDGVGREAREAERQLARDVEAAEKRRKSLGIPRRIFDALESAKTEHPTFSASALWVDERRKNPSAWCLTLSGPKGCGKSVGGGNALHDIAGERGGGPSIYANGSTRFLRCWWTAAELAGCGVYSGELSALCEYAGPLVLDDLGTEYADAKGFFSQILDRLIDARYREYAPTIITTNLNAKSFGERYGERVVDRLREGGRFVEFGGVESMRGK